MIKIEARQAFLEKDLEIRARLDRLQRIDRAMYRPNLIFGRCESSGQEPLDLTNAQTLKKLKEASIPLFEDRDFRRQVFEAVLQVVQVLVGVYLQRFGKVVRQTDVIDDEAALFAVRNSIHARDGLEEVVLLQPLVDVHHLLDGRVEAGQQHVANDQERNARVRLVGIIESEGHA